MVASPERAGTCPVLRVCHPQLVHGAAERKWGGGGVGGTNERSRWRNEVATGTEGRAAWQEMTSYFGGSVR